MLLTILWNLDSNIFFWGLNIFVPAHLALHPDGGAQCLRGVGGPRHDRGHALHDELPLRAVLAVVPRHALVPDNKYF